MKRRVIPKGCNNINYVSMHEYMHLLTMSEIDKPHSEILNLYRKVLRDVEYRKVIPISANSMQDAYEFVADYLTADLNDKVSRKIITYLFGGK